MIDTEEQAVDTERRGTDSRKRVIALLLLLWISLLALLRSSYTISTYQLFSSSNDTKNSSSTATLHPISSKTLPIYLIDTSDINQTNIAASTWGEISTNWNRTTQYSNLLSFATAVPSLPNQKYNNNATTISNVKNKRRQIILIHCGPKLGSTTLRRACRKTLQQTCPQINFTTYLNNRERRSHAPPGYFGGDRLVSVMNECVDTYHFCVFQVTEMDLNPSENKTTEITITSEELDADTVTTTTTNTAAAATLSQNVQYIHLFPFRNYNDWVKSAIKQQYDRSGEKGCLTAKNLWDGGKCQHHHMEIDIRKYSRVDLDRFQDGIVKRMNKNQLLLTGRKQGQEEEEQHTLLLYLHRDLQRTMRELSTRYQLPMLPGTGETLKGKRPNGTCNESLVELYHECFSDSLMEFGWDLSEKQLQYNRATDRSSSLRSVDPPKPEENSRKTNHLEPLTLSEAKSSSCTFCRILNSSQFVYH